MQVAKHSTFLRTTPPKNNKKLFDQNNVVVEKHWPGTTLSVSEEGDIYKHP